MRGGRVITGDERSMTGNVNFGDKRDEYETVDNLDSEIERGMNSKTGLSGRRRTGNFDPAESMSSEHRGGVFLESPLDFECNRSSENSAIRAYFHASL